MYLSYSSFLHQPYVINYVKINIIELNLSNLKCSKVELVNNFILILHKFRYSFYQCNAINSAKEKLRISGLIIHSIRRL